MGLNTRKHTRNDEGRRVHSRVPRQGATDGFWSFTPLFGCDSRLPSTCLPINRRRVNSDLQGWAGRLPFLAAPRVRYCGGALLNFVHLQVLAGRRRGGSVAAAGRVDPLAQPGRQRHLTRQRPWCPPPPARLVLALARDACPRRACTVPTFSDAITLRSDYMLSDASAMPCMVTRPLGRSQPSAAPHLLPRRRTCLHRRGLLPAALAHPRRPARLP